MSHRSRDGVFSTQDTSQLLREHIQLGESIRRPERHNIYYRHITHALQPWTCLGITPSASLDIKCLNLPVTFSTKHVKGLIWPMWNHCRNFFPEKEKLQMMFQHDSPDSYWAHAWKWLISLANFSLTDYLFVIIAKMVFILFKWWFCKTMAWL